MIPIKRILLSLFILSLFSCRSQTKKIDLIKIYFVPNNYTTYNYGKATFRDEYRDYGAFFSVKNQELIDKVKGMLSNLEKTTGGRIGKRIKVVVLSNKKTDTIYFPYLPKGKVEYNGVSHSGNVKLFDLIVTQIENHYKKGEFICEGKKCNNIPEKKNLEFLSNQVGNRLNK